MLDPELLKNFLHVIDLGSLSQASRMAHVTQPALSRQIRILEEELGQTLFERTGRGMRPTIQGKKLELSARPLLQQFENLKREFVDAPVSGPLALVVTPSVGMAWTADLVGRFRKKYPLIEIRVVAALSGSAAESIAYGRFDIGVVYSPVHQEGLVSEALWEEQSFLVCRKSERLGPQASITLAEALKGPLILPSSQYGIRALLEELAEEQKMTLNIAMEVDSVQLALEFVKKGVGRLILTERGLSDIAQRRLKALPIRRPRVVRSAEVAASETALLRAPVRAFWDFLLDEEEGVRPHCQI